MKTRMLVCVLVIFVLGLCTNYSIAEDFDWPRWRGPYGDGVSMETDWNPNALEKGQKIVWRINVGMGYSSVVIKDDRLYTMGCIGGGFVVFCLNAESGDSIWQSTFESESAMNPQSTPTIDGKYVYVIGGEGKLVCLDARKGNLRWMKNLVEELHAETPVYGFATSPVVDENLLIININEYGTALNKKPGKRSGPVHRRMMKI